MSSVTVKELVRRRRVTRLGLRRDGLGRKRVPDVRKQEEEEEEEEVEIIKPTPKPKPPPPKKIIKPLEIQPKLFFMKNVDNQNLISGMISQAIKKKSKFYNLVKDSSTIYITQGIHNSFHKTEKYNHFNIKLSQDHITFHIYIDEARILYFTKLTFEYD